MYLMKSYDNALQEILDNGVKRTNKRTGIGTLSVFGMLTKYPLNKGYFPLLTKRKISPKAVFAELIWFLSGNTNNNKLKELGCNFWTPWVDPAFEEKHGYAAGAFGPVYGFQLRHFGGYYGNGIGGIKGSDKDYRDCDDPTIPCDQHLMCPDGPHSVYGRGGFDQLTHVINTIKNDPSDRRTLWTLWNPQDVSEMKLPPCHMLYQVLVDDERRLTGILYQRSCDFPVGVPANIQFYSALTMLLAQQTNCTAQEFVHVTADSHIYLDQVEAVQKYLALPEIQSPKLTITPVEHISQYTPAHFVLSEFNPGPKLEIPVAV